MSAAPPHQRLAAVVDRPAEEFQAFAALPPEQVEQLADAVVETGRRQQAQLQEAVEESLRYVPTLMRRPVKAALGLR